MTENTTTDFIYEVSIGSDAQLYRVDPNPWHHGGTSPDSLHHRNEQTIPAGSLVRWDGKRTDRSGDLFAIGPNGVNMHYVDRSCVELIPDPGVPVDDDDEPELTYLDGTNWNAYAGRIVRWMAPTASSSYVLIGADADTGDAIVALASLDAWTGELTSMLTPDVRPWTTPETQCHLDPRYTDITVPRYATAAILREFEGHRGQKRATERVQQVADAAQAKIDEIVERMHTEADERGWCSEFDDIAADLGLPRREREYTVRVHVDLSEIEIDVPVTARSAEAAEQLVDDGDPDQWNLDAVELENKIIDAIRSGWHPGNGSYDARFAELSDS